MLFNLQEEKKKWSDLLEVLGQLEIKGGTNVFLMYKIMNFVQGEVVSLEKKIQEESKQGG